MIDGIRALMSRELFRLRRRVGAPEKERECRPAAPLRGRTAVRGLSNSHLLLWLTAVTISGRLAAEGKH